MLANIEVGIAFTFLLKVYPLFVILLAYYYFSEFALLECALLFHEYGCYTKLHVFAYENFHIYNSLYYICEEL